MGPQLAEVAPDGLDHVFSTTATAHHLDAYAGVVRSTAHRDFGRVTAANLRRAHRTLESGTAIGKITLTGF